MTIDQIWRLFEREAKIYPAYQSFDNLVLAVDALFAIGAVKVNPQGELERQTLDISICA
jgi:hypothetical protein